MSDLLEHDLREAFAERSTLISHEASARLRAIDYHPRARRLPSRPALGALGLSGAAAAVGAAFLLASGATPAFAGWTPTPTAPVSGQLVAAAQDCGVGTPVLSDTRGPYTASIYADGSTCVAGNGITINSSSTGQAAPVLPAGTVELRGVGESDSAGHALTMVDGRTGAGVTSVNITRSDGSSVQATVRNGWYLAWWPGTQRPVTAQLSTTGGNRTQSFPTSPGNAAPACPAGAHCSSGYGFDSASGAHTGRTTLQTTGNSSSGQ